jgi:hypothetical protein
MGQLKGTPIDPKKRGEKHFFRLILRLILRPITYRERQVGPILNYARVTGACAL